MQHAFFFQIIVNKVVSNDNTPPASWEGVQASCILRIIHRQSNINISTSSELHVRQRRFGHQCMPFDIYAACIVPIWGWCILHRMENEPCCVVYNHMDFIAEFCDRVLDHRCHGLLIGYVTIKRKRNVVWIGKSLNCLDMVDGFIAPTVGSVLSMKTTWLCLRFSDTKRHWKRNRGRFKHSEQDSSVL